MDYEGVSIASLMLAIVAVWIRPRQVWAVPFCVFVVTGLISGWLTPWALLSGSLLALLVALHASATNRSLRRLSTTALVVGAVVFGVHLAPGFETVERFTGTRFDHLFAQGGVRFTADKPLVGLFLLLAYRDQLCKTVSAFTKVFLRSVVPMSVGIACVYAAALATGYVKLAPVLPELGLVPLMIILFARNLLFSVVAEEMLFRLVIQSRLETVFQGQRAKVYALITASVLFGLVHVPGGWQFGLLATMAGAVYGTVFMKTRRVEVAMLAHIALNTGQTLLFSTSG